MNNTLQRITNHHLSRWMEYRREDRRADENSGRVDGENGIPSLNDHHCAFQGNLVRSAIADLHSFNYKRLLYITELTHTERELEATRSTYRSRQTQLLHRNARVTTFIDETMGPDSPDMKDAKEAVGRAETKLHDLERQLGRPLRTSMVTTYPYVMLLLSMVEVPINRFAFEIFFLQQPVISNMIALAVGMILIALAHIVGLWMRHASNYVTLTARSGHYIGSAIATIPSSALIFFLGLMRERYLKIITDDQGTNFGDLLNRALQGDIGNGIAKMAAINIRSAGLILIAINTAIFMLGCFLSFIRHDPNLDYERTAIDYIAAKTHRQRLHNSYSKRRSKAERRFEQQEQYLNSQINRVEKLIAAINLKRADATSHLYHVLRVMSNVIVGRISTYQYSNTRSRGGDSPPCLRPIEHSEISNLLSRALDE